MQALTLRALHTLSRLTQTIESQRQALEQNKRLKSFLYQWEQLIGLLQTTQLTKNLYIKILSCEQEELIESLHTSTEPETHFLQLLLDSELQQAGSEPYSVLLTFYQFDFTKEHSYALSMLSHITQACFCGIVVGSTTNQPIFSAPSYEISKFKKMLSGSQYDAWRNFLNYENAYLIHINIDHDLEPDFRVSNQFQGNNYLINILVFLKFHDHYPHPYFKFRRLFTKKENLLLSELGIHSNIQSDQPEKLSGKLFSLSKHPLESDFSTMIWIMRLIHHLKAYARECIGFSKKIDKIERNLLIWLHQFVASNSTEQSNYPLREAKLWCQTLPGKTEHYICRILLKLNHPAQDALPLQFDLIL